MEKGKVVTIDGEKVKVVFSRGAGCGSCKACSEGQNKNEMEIVAYNDCNAKIGDTVKVSIETEFLLKATGIMYGIPLITMMCGFLLGNLVSPLVSFITGILFLFITYFIIKKSEHKFQNRNFTAKAVEVVDLADVQQKL